MKKLSTLIALILIATIGGVYATWTYVGDGQTHTLSTKGVVMTELEVSTAAVGSYHIQSKLSQGIIDQNKGEDTAPEKYHKAVLTYETTTNANLAENVLFAVEFTPTATVGADVLNKGVITYLWFGAPGMQYDLDGDGTVEEGEDIFNVPYGADNYITIHPVGTSLDGMDSKTNFKWTKNGSKFVCNIIGEGLEHTGFESIFTLNNVVLDTEAKYTAFKNAISKFIRCVVSNKVPAETIIPN